jgi:hypothetical protein
MEIRFDDYVISFAGLSPWKRFMLLCGLSYGAYQLTITPGVESTYIGGAWSMVLVAWTFYFTTHEDDTAPEEVSSEAPAQAPRLKTKEELELEIFNGSGKFLNQPPK